MPDAAKLTPKLKELNSNLEDNVRLSDAELDHLDKVIEKVSLYHIGLNSNERILEYILDSVAEVCPCNRQSGGGDHHFITSQYPQY